MSCQRNPADTEGRDDAELYRQAIELARLVEECGLDSYWVTEHHFLDDCYMPACLPVLAAAAAATERVQLGAGVVLAPLHDPIRLAEDAAVVDLISRGRLILGLGLGWREEEFHGFGLETRERVPRLVKTVETLRAAWASKGRVGEHGVIVTPKPFREAGPPVWLGGMVDAAIDRAGELADGFMASVPPTDQDTLRKYGTRLRAKSPNIDVSAHVGVFVWDGPEDPWEVVREFQWYKTWKYSEMADGGPHGSRAGCAPRPPDQQPDDEEMYTRNFPWGAESATIHGGNIVGRPDEVLKALRSAQSLLTDNGHFVANAYFPGMPWEIQVRQVELLGEIAEELRRD